MSKSKSYTNHTERKYSKEDMSEIRLKDLARPDITPTEMIQRYDDWADTYGQHLDLSTYRPPIITAQEVTSLFGNKHDVRILDCGAGTGIIATALKRANFTNIDGLDASKRMLDMAAEHNIYREYICELLGPNRLPIDDNAYDCALLVGCLVPGHVKGDCFEELLRITKPGGYVLMMTRERYLNADPELHKLESQIQNVCESGRWERVTRRIIDNYYLEDKGILIICKVL